MCTLTKKILPVLAVSACFSMLAAGCGSTDTVSQETAAETATEAVTETTELPSPEEEEPVDVSSLYYSWIRDNMLAELGYADQQTTSRTLNAKIGSSDYWQDNACWDSRFGLAGANIADLNADGNPECIVYTYEKDNERTMYNNGLHPICLNITLLTCDPETAEIQKLNTVMIEDLTNVGFDKIRAGIIAIGEQNYVYVESNGNSYFASGSGVAYDFFTYDGTQLRMQWLVGKTGGGSDQIVYSLRTYSDAENYTDEAIAGYGSAGESVLGSDTVCVREALVYGFNEIGLGEPEDETYTDADWHVNEEKTEAFPTYWNSENFTKGIEFTCSGVGDYSEREMTVSSSDETGLQAILEGETTE